ncbi:HipA domain-containing protein [Rheinheimera sp.]|uniref:type II toxin-antitoxin system HipA family toxin n=1 Tax=Rheinheimera sp. TaxID=1869214 RepID=UPI00307DEB1F
MILQLYFNGTWHDAAALRVTGPGKDAAVQIDYLMDYLRQPGVHYDSCAEHAVTVNAPVSAVATEYPNWPGLLDDLLPAGKSRQWWLTKLDLTHLPVFDADCALLRHTCMAPVGNLRVKDAVPQTAGPALEFSQHQVCELQHDFLEHANSQGAAVGGATGATGVAPKLLLMLSGDSVFIDGDFAGKPRTATPYLVKFARNFRSPRDNQVLKAEGAYYKVLTQVLEHTSIQTMDTQLMQTHEADGQVSLWLPRFDVVEQQGVMHRLGMESVYSVLNAGPGSAWDHFDVVRILWRKLQGVLTQNCQQFVTEYLMRDLLNLVFGNSDNHGRNQSFLKQNGRLSFAPIYDFAPMKADPEQVTRLFKWGHGTEIGAEVNFALVAERLADLIDPNTLLQELRTLAQQLIQVPQLLEEAGCPEEILQFPAIGFAHLPEKLQKMKLV